MSIMTFEYYDLGPLTYCEVEPSHEITLFAYARWVSQSAVVASYR